MIYNSQTKDDLYYEIKDYIKDLGISTVIHILADIIEESEVVE